MIGRCPDCPAKEATIAGQKGTLAAMQAHVAFLEAQVKELQAKLIEVVSPGANARLAWTPPPPRPKKEGAGLTSHNPARLAQLRADRPVPKGPEDKPTSHEVTAQDVERSFLMDQG